ncbi:hypothetical protein [Shewanella algidipiscicola]|uniref:Uncharacterized protein n=1 Tax=Shewanella algidipiscicola TaxID=614070 RepID=A0ABQ4P6S8_9GAMM|nr:hypothetical protein [Shewanella algidipiscicola]GIU43123.1 hypothetical protein TUM4630_05650 [Shewanella algidipiscicola]
MKRPHLAMLLLICLYLVTSVIAVWRTLATQSLDLFTIGVIPVVIGLLLRAEWAGLLLKIYIAIQTIAFSALGMTAVIAYQITPEEVKVVFKGQQISIPLIVVVVSLLLLFQWWVALSKSTKAYLSRAEQAGPPVAKP